MELLRVFDGERTAAENLPDTVLALEDNTVTYVLALS